MILKNIKINQFKKGGKMQLRPILKNEIFQTIANIIAVNRDILPGTVLINSNFKEDLEIDSITMFEIIMDVELHYGIFFEDEKTENIVIVENLLDLVFEKIEK